MLYAAQIMSATALELVKRPALLEDARKELDERLQGRAYECPIPADVQPALVR